MAGNPTQIPTWGCITNISENEKNEGKNPIQLRFGLVKLEMSASVQVAKSLSLIFLAGRSAASVVEGLKGHRGWASNHLNIVGHQPACNPLTLICINVFLGTHGLSSSSM